MAVDNVNDDGRAGGRAFYVADCYIWAEISYLDSSTDYREYLPIKKTNWSSGADDLVLLDDDSWLARVEDIVIHYSQKLLLLDDIPWLARVKTSAFAYMNSFLVALHIDPLPGHEP